MLNGYAQISDGQTVHLHHIMGRRGDKYFIFMEIKERDHALVHSLTGKIGGLYKRFPTVMHLMESIFLNITGFYTIVIELSIKNIQE